MKHVMPLGIYLGIGALMHAMFVGPHFDWTSAWTFGWLFGWPVALFVTFWAIILTVGLVMIVIALIYVIVDHVLTKRSAAKARAARTAGRRP